MSRKMYYGGPYDPTKEDVVGRMASPRHDTEDYNLIMAEGQIDGWIDDGEVGHWVAYLPSCFRAVWITNGDPVWLDAVSLEDAVRQIENGADLVN